MCGVVNSPSTGYRYGSSIGHAFIAAAIGAPLAPPRVTARYWIAGILCTVLLNIDAIGRPFGWGDLSVLGNHRALTHSLVFALVLGVGVTWLGFRQPWWDGTRSRIVAYLILATASHGVLDAFASYGSGVAFLYPFSTARFAAPWRPLRALNEIYWIWLPAAALIAVAWLRRRARTS